VKVEAGHSQVPTVNDLLEDATARLSTALGFERRDARLEAQILASRALGVDRAWLIAHDQDVLTADQAEAVEKPVARRVQGEPVAYILGEKEFYGRLFRVTPNVLIPRPETELLVETALQHIPARIPYNILDLGSGSGAVAITLALERPFSKVVAVDTSAAALSITQGNARRLGADNVDCIGGNWYASLGVKKFDMIVSNPPYVAAADSHLDAGDLRFEPRQALASGEDGLDDLRVIIAGAPAHLVDHGWLFVEHGYDQSAEVGELLRQHGFGQTCSLRDLAGLGRVSGGCWPNKVD
jgi:release factor glutamine methyltransferase